MARIVPLTGKHFAAQPNTPDFVTKREPTPDELLKLFQLGAAGVSAANKIGGLVAGGVSRLAEPNPAAREAAARKEAAMVLLHDEAGRRAEATRPGTLAEPGYDALATSEQGDAARADARAIGDAALRGQEDLSPRPTQVQEAADAAGSTAAQPIVQAPAYQPPRPMPTRDMPYPESRTLRENATRQLWLNQREQMATTDAEREDIRREKLALKMGVPFDPNARVLQSTPEAQGMVPNWRTTPRQEALDQTRANLRLGQMPADSPVLPGNNAPIGHGLRDIAESARVQPVQVPDQVIGTGALTGLRSKLSARGLDELEPMLQRLKSSADPRAAQVVDEVQQVVDAKKHVATKTELDQLMAHPDDTRAQIAATGLQPGFSGATDYDSLRQRMAIAATTNNYKEAEQVLRDFVANKGQGVHPETLEDLITGKHHERALSELASMAPKLVKESPGVQIFTGAKTEKTAEETRLAEQRVAVEKIKAAHAEKLAVLDEGLKSGRITLQQHQALKARIDADTELKYREAQIYKMEHPGPLVQVGGAVNVIKTGEGVKTKEQEQANRTLEDIRKDKQAAMTRIDENTAMADTGELPVDATSLRAVPYDSRKEEAQRRTKHNEEVAKARREKSALEAKVKRLDAEEKAALQGKRAAVSESPEGSRNIVEHNVGGYVAPKQADQVDESRVNSRGQEVKTMNGETWYRNTTGKPGHRKGHGTWTRELSTVPATVAPTQAPAPAKKPLSALKMWE
jgi:hypothetical protein